MKRVRLSKKLLDKYFVINEGDQELWGHDAMGKIDKIFYEVPFEQTHRWNLVWFIEKKYLVIEDDPIIQMRYLDELQYILKLGKCPITIKEDERD